MDSFVRRLVERLVAEGRPLSRNRHFHTFDTPEGRLALRTARRLRALARDMARCREGGGTVQLHLRPDNTAARALEVCLLHRVGTHRAFLSQAELDILRGLPGLAPLLGEPTGTRRTA